MKIHPKDFRVPKGNEVKLDEWPTVVDRVYGPKDQYKTLLAKHVEQLSSLQELLYASNRHAILLIFQAMDAAGKDGVIQHVMSGVNPQGCQVFSFKHPTRLSSRSTISCGARPATFRDADGSASSIAPITRKC